MPTPATPPALQHRHLALFRAVMLHGSLSRAAEALGSSQPTLSRDLARLEQLLGYTLFERVRSRLRPTERAFALMQEVERSYQGLERVAQRALELRHHSATPLRVGCLPALAQALLPAALARLAQQAPLQQVLVEPLESPWLEQAASEQRLDLAVGECTEAPTGTHWQSLLQAQEVAVLPRSHALARKAVLAPQDFANQPFVSLAATDPYRVAIDALFARHGVVRQLRVETASAVAVCALVAQGLGLGIVNPLTARALAPTGLVVRPLSEPIPFRLGLLLPHTRATHPWRDALVLALQGCAGELSSQTNNS
ncbi:MAG: LysR family transcriptional regulator [Rhodoferax sp.]